MVGRGRTTGVAGDEARRSCSGSTKLGGSTGVRHLRGCFLAWHGPGQHAVHLLSAHFADLLPPQPTHRSCGSFIPGQTGLAVLLACSSMALRRSRRRSTRRNAQPKVLAPIKKGRQNWPRSLKWLSQLRTAAGAARELLLLLLSTQQLGTS